MFKCKLCAWFSNMLTITGISYLILFHFICFSACVCWILREDPRLSPKLCAKLIVHCRLLPWGLDVPWNHECSLPASYPFGSDLLFSRTQNVSPFCSVYLGVSTPLPPPLSPPTDLHFLFTNSSPFIFSMFCIFIHVLSSSHLCPTPFSSSILFLSSLSFTYQSSLLWSHSAFLPSHLPFWFVRCLSFVFTK